MRTFSASTSLSHSPRKKELPAVSPAGKQTSSSSFIMHSSLIQFQLFALPSPRGSPKTGLNYFYDVVSVHPSIRTLVVCVTQHHFLLSRTFPYGQTDKIKITNHVSRASPKDDSEDSLSPERLFSTSTVHTHHRTVEYSADLRLMKFEFTVAFLRKRTA